MTRSDLSRELFGRRFQNPLLLAAGTAGFGRELDGVVDLERLGGIVTKAVSVEPRRGNPPPRVAEFPGGMLNSVGLANPGLERVRSDHLPWLVARLRRAHILVNVVGFTVEEYGEVVRRLDGLTGLAGFELNLSCPNTSAGGIEFGADAGCVQRIVSTCRARTKLPLIAKLSPLLPDIGAMALAARDAGADAVTAVNTLPGMLWHSDGRARLGQGNGGISGPALLPLGVLAVGRILDRTGGMPVIGVGGVRSAADVRQYLRAGASLVALGTGALADPRLPERIVRDLELDRG
ncbi:MAG TPA: dihydroorotate dehydrogenase [Gemmatimonadales bacterium]|nr:dihydroorotate dehydrogenase [Gemmatimonadales bacterium]